ncbi:hypothetical protein [Deinococcus daejeonensis]|uniref:Leucine rich repeat variant n=1 Tax=Deinococcus daejeonensis TaxID=1007098 RepID=A0ABQ2JEJ1_9DEIO|nr:hypothetical protein [Deinococcus daejeonensis]GGN44896.1 hypothetical protein GCM10010842_33870 [Deinococcus daejeonensis]
MSTVDWKSLKRESRKQGTSAKRLLELAAMGPELSREVAKGQHTPPHVLQALAAHPDPLTVAAVASNPNTPPQILEGLSLKNMALAKNVSHNKSTPELTLERLAKSQSSSIREAVSYNPSTPLHVLLILRDDPNSAVSDHLLLRSMALLGNYGKTTDVPAEKLLRAMALTDLIPAEAACRLSECSDPDVQLSLLENIDKVALSVRGKIRAHLMQEGAHP